jgi:hypothetical protein
MTSNKHLPIAWYKGCRTDEEKRNREEFIRNSTQICSLFLSILQDRYELVERRGFKEEDYAEAGWVTLQAFRNGKLAELNDLGELFSFLNPDKG